MANPAGVPKLALLFDSNDSFMHSLDFILVPKWIIEIKLFLPFISEKKYS